MSQTRLDTRAFQLTVSVPGDLSAACQDAIVDYVVKNTIMRYVVIEYGKQGTHRHLHALMIYKRGREKRQLENNIYDRFVKIHHPDASRRDGVVVQVCPGNKWYDDYLQKEQNCELITSNWDRDAAEEHFPSQAVQEVLMAKAKLKDGPCPWLAKAVASWTGSTFENTPEGALMYLKHCMFVERSMVPVSDLRKRTEKAYMFWEYRNGVVSPTERELWLLKQLQDGPAYDVPTIRRGPESSAPPSI